MNKKLNKKMIFFILYRSHFGSSVRQSVSGRKSFWFVVMNDYCSEIRNTTPIKMIPRHLAFLEEVDKISRISRHQDISPKNKKELKIPPGKKLGSLTTIKEKEIEEKEEEIEVIKEKEIEVIEEEEKEIEVIEEEEIDRDKFLRERVKKSLVAAVDDYWNSKRKIF